jgi:hypothetical protein
VVEERQTKSKLLEGTEGKGLKLPTTADDYFSDLVTAPRTGSRREPRGATGAWLPALADDGLIKPVELAHLGVHIGVGEQASAFEAPGLHGAAGCGALADGGDGSPCLVPDSFS